MINRRTLALVLFFMRAYRGRTILLVLLLVLSGLAEGIGIVTMLPLLELYGGTDGASISPITRLVEEKLRALGVEPRLEVLLLMIVAGMVLKAAFNLLAMMQVGHTVARVTTDMRLALIRALMKARWSYFVSQPAGRFNNAIGGEAGRAANAYRSACAAMAVGIQALMYAGVAFLASWQVAVFGLFGGLLVILVLSRFVGLSRAAGSRQTQLMDSLLKRLTDALHGIKPIKAMGREGHVQPLLEGETHGLNEVQQKQVLASEGLRSAQEPLLVIMLAAALYFSLSVREQSLPSVLIMGFLFYRLAGRLSLLQMEYQGIAVGESAFWGIREQIALAEANEDPKAGGTRTPALDHEIRLEQVNFGYGNQRVLKDLNLVIPAGRFVALTGSSGVGKTTVADLIIGLHQPQSGRILIDGVPLDEVDTAYWRGLIGYVPQEMLLFHDTVFNNVSLGDPAVTREDVEASLRAAGLWETIAALPDRLDSMLGERGSKLSGGQRQRVAIARALVRRPRLVVLDEVTTALDPSSEADICRTLRDLQGVTILAISHQRAIADTADIVYRLEPDRLSVVRDDRARRVAVGQ